MGRRRSTNHHLPQRVYFSRGSYFYVDAAGKWHPLGKEWNRASKDEWSKLTTGKAADGSVAKLLDDFLTHCEAEVRAGRRSARTLTDNESERDMLKLVFGRMHHGAVTSRHCAQYLRTRRDRKGKLAPVRANREIAFLSSSYSWAMGEPGYDIERNPAYGVRRNTERPRDRYVETWEVRAFAKRYAPAWLRCYVLMKRLIALRQSDMLRLGDEHLTDRGIEIATGKTGKRIIFRWTWALRTVVKAAQSLRKPEPPDSNVKRLHAPLFPSRHGTHLTARGLKSAWQRGMQAYAAAGFERFWEHDLRAKSSSDSTDIHRAQELLGHSTSATTGKHYRRAPAKVRPLR